MLDGLIDIYLPDFKYASPTFPVNILRTRLPFRCGKGNCGNVQADRKGTSLMKTV